eukprot:scaffold16.g51.t1
MTDKAENAKTQICLRWKNGECRFGDRCNFAHGEDELRTLPPRTPSAGGAGRGRGRGAPAGVQQQGGRLIDPAVAAPGSGQGYGRTLAAARPSSGAAQHRQPPPNGRITSSEYSAWVASGCPIKGPNGWMQYKTESGEHYYHHLEHELTQWEAPADWRPLSRPPKLT